MRCLIVFALICSTTAPSRADTLDATRNQAVSETSHVATVQVRDGLAYYKVRRVFRNRGKLADEARLTINMPFGAVATGLRIKGKDRWYDGDLMHATKAEELYVELTGMGPSEPKDPALLYWRWTDELALRVFPIFPGRTSTIEYSLTAPTTYADGTYYFTYGRKPEANNLVAPELRIRGRGIAALEIDGEAAKRNTVLSPIRLHPVLEQNNIDNPKVLVRTIVVRGQPRWRKASIQVDIRHTWRGDIEIAAVSPDGTLHQLRDESLGDGANDLAKTFSVDYKGDPNGAWHLLITDHHPLDGGTLRRWSVASAGDSARAFGDRKPSFIPQPTESQAGLATVGVRMRRQPTEVRLGRVALVQNKPFARFELDVARQLSKLPKPLAVSFVVDLSHTMDKAGIDAQLDVASAYLSHVPWARFSLVGFGRNAHKLTGFVPAKRFDAVRDRLEKSGALAPRNGSFLDRGTQAAVPELVKQNGSRALLLLTDDRLRRLWQNKRAMAALRALPSDAVVHVVDVAPGGELGLSRDDDHRLFPLAKLRHGVATAATGIREAKRSELRAHLLYLVRPNRVDHVKITGLGKAGKTILDAAEASDGVLREGTGVRWMGSIAVPPTSAVVSGQLWSKPVSFTGRSNDEPFNRATAGFVFSHDHYQGLTDAEQFVLAMYAGVVSPVTSFLAIEPGVRPSTIGLEHGGGTGWGTIGTGRYGTVGHGGGSGATVDWRAVAGRVDRACKRHGKADVTASLEMQGREIADIRLSRTSGNSALDQCVVDTLWAENLPSWLRRRGDWAKQLTIRVGR